MAGNAIYVGGKWHLNAGAYEAPTFTITEDILIEGVTIRAKIPKRDRFNTVKGIYTAPGSSNSYQPQDYPAYVDTAAKTDDARSVKPVKIVITRLVPIVGSPCRFPSHSSMDMARLAVPL